LLTILPRSSSAVLPQPPSSKASWSRCASVDSGTYGPRLWPTTCTRARGRPRGGRVCDCARRGGALVDGHPSSRAAVALTRLRAGLPLSGADGLQVCGGSLRSPATTVALFLHPHGYHGRRYQRPTSRRHPLYTTAHDQLSQPTAAHRRPLPPAASRCRPPQPAVARCFPRSLTSRPFSTPTKRAFGLAGTAVPLLHLSCEIA